MSLVSSRVSLLHRCTIERNQAATDEWGNPGPPNWADHLADIPCRAWVVSGSEPVSEDRTVTVITHHIVLPLGTDVTEDDRVASISERGTEILGGPLPITAVLYRQDHRELLLERVR